MASSIGASFYCDAINWLKGKPFVHSAAYRQPGRNGNGHALGPKYADPSTLRSTHFIAAKGSEDALLDQAADLCATTQTVYEEAMHATAVVTLEVFFESFKVVKSNACAGPGNTGYVVILEWVCYIPVLV